MPIPIKSEEELEVGDFFEDCAYHPCLVVTKGNGTVQGISLVDGSFPRDCGGSQCGVRKLTPREAIEWRFYGPPDVPAEIEVTGAQKWWLKDQYRARDLWPLRP